MTVNERRTTWGLNDTHSKKKKAGIRTHIMVPGLKCHFCSCFCLHYFDIAGFFPQSVLLKIALF